jgi:hypothetical protein
MATTGVSPVRAPTQSRRLPVSQSRRPVTPQPFSHHPAFTSPGRNEAATGAGRTLARAVGVRADGGTRSVRPELPAPRAVGQLGAAGRGNPAWRPPRMSRNLEVAVAGSMSRDAHRGPAGPSPRGQTAASWPASASVSPLVTASCPRDPAAQRQRVLAQPTGSGFGGNHGGSSRPGGVSCQGLTKTFSSC